MTAPVWGCPWHGLVERLSAGAARINLPNGELKAWPVPPLAGAETCDTMLVQVPGVPPVVRTPEEEASDTANGWQWWDRAILYGTNQTLHGTPVNGWIYCDPVGRRWKVSKISSISGSYSVKLSLFGEFGRAEEEYTYPVVVADMGQSTPTISNIATIGLRLRDTSPDGSKALYVVRGTRPSSASGFGWPSDTQDRWTPALGWLEMTISGPGEDATIQLTVLATRAQTIGVFELDPDTRPPAVQYWKTTTETEVDLPEKRTTTTSVEYHSEETTDPATAGDPYNDGVSVDWGHIGTCGEIQGRRGVILAMWYGDDGSVEQVTFDIERHRVEVVSPVTWVVDGVDVVEFIKPSGPTTELSRYSVTSYQQSLEDTTWSAVLRHNGVECGRIDVTSHTERVHRSDRDIGMWVEVDGEYSGPIADPRNLVMSAVPGNESLDLSVDSRFMALDRYAYGFGATIRIAPYQLSNHLWCLLRCDQEGESSSEWVHIWTWGPMVGPGGITDGETTTQIFTSTSLRLYGSWCPITGQTVRSTQPKLWT
jgi:hypothetical protein